MNLDKKEADLKIKKMARELGLDKNPIPPQELALPQPSASSLDTIKGLLPLLSKLAPEQLEGLIDQFLPSEEEGEGSTGIDSLLDFVNKNPEIVRGFLDKMGGKGGTQEKDYSTQV